MRLEVWITSCRLREQQRVLQVQRLRAQQRVRRAQQMRQRRAQVQRQEPVQQQVQLLVFCHKRPEQRPTRLPAGGIFS